MAQRRYVPPMLRQLGSTKSRIWQTVNSSPRAAQLWREIFLRAVALMDQGMPDDPEVIAKDPEILMMVMEIEPEFWGSGWKGGSFTGDG